MSSTRRISEDEARRARERATLLVELIEGADVEVGRSHGVTIRGIAHELKAFVERVERAAAIEASS